MKLRIIWGFETSFEVSGNFFGFRILTADFGIQIDFDFRVDRKRLCSAGEKSLKIWYTERDALKKI